MKRHLLQIFATLGCAAFLLPACSDYNAAELVNCEKAAINLMSNSQIIPLKVMSANMLRRGQLKLLSVEAYYRDSIRVILNLADARYTTESQLRNDSLHTGTYTYVARPGADTTGKVLLGIKTANNLQYINIDSSSITITEIDAANRTLSGSYYLRTASPAITVNGGFSKVCFLSIQ